MDDAFSCWETIERDLREKMMFGLELHSSHQKKPEEVLFSIVTAGKNLVVNEWNVQILFISFLAFMVSN